MSTPLSNGDGLTIPTPVRLQRLAEILVALTEQMQIEMVVSPYGPPDTYRPTVEAYDGELRIIYTKQGR